MKMDIYEFDGWIVKNPDQIPLVVAEQKSLIEEIFNYGADINWCDENGHTMLHHASSEGCVEIVQLLVNKGFALDKRKSFDQTPLIIYARRSHREVAELLIKAGVDVYCCDISADIVLPGHGFTWRISEDQFLLSKGVDPENYSSCGTALLMAVRMAHREVIELFTNSGADIHCCVKDLL